MEKPWVRRIKVRFSKHSGSGKFVLFFLVAKFVAHRLLETNYSLEKITSD